MWDAVGLVWTATILACAVIAVAHIVGRWAFNRIRQVLEHEGMSKAGCIEGIVSKRLGTPYCSGRIAALGQEQEPRAPSSEAGSRRGLGKMTRRKREIIGLTNERKDSRGRNRLIPLGGFRSAL